MSPLTQRINEWKQELELDEDNEFLLNGISEGFHLIPPDAPLVPAEMENYVSATCPSARSKVEHTIREEIREGNYVVAKSKPIIVSAIGAVPKPDSDDCSMPEGKCVNSYVPHIDKLRFQSIDDAIKLIDKGYYLAKIDLRHVYRSVPIHPSNYAATGLKWLFEGDSVPTYFIDTRLPFGGRRAPGTFHHLSQSVRHIMLRQGFHSIVVYLDDFSS